MNLTGYENVNSDLSDRLKGKAQLLIDILRTSDKPIYAGVLADALHEREADTRQLISWLRLQMKEIASGGKGFSWAWWREDLQSTRDHLYQREVKIHIVRVAVEQRCAQLPSKAEVVAIQSELPIINAGMGMAI